MSTRRVQIVLLCEDSQHDVFMRRFLQKMGWNNRSLKPKISPSGEGSAEQWVREQFLNELIIYRERQAKAASALIVMIDADLLTLRDRIKDFQNECASQSIPFRRATEAVAIAIPKRNIETWIHFLNGTQVNEETPYSKLARESDCWPAVDNLVQRCNTGAQAVDALPDSLKSACTEYNDRIRPLRRG